MHVIISIILINLYTLTWLIKIVLTEFYKEGEDTGRKDHDKRRRNGEEQEQNNRKNMMMMMMMIYGLNC